MHWTWTVNLEDQGTQCQLEKPTCDATNQTETMLKSVHISPPDTEKIVGAMIESPSDTDTVGTSYSEASSSPEDSDETFYSGTTEDSDDTYHSGTTEDSDDSISDSHETDELENWFNRIEF